MLLFVLHMRDSGPYGVGERSIARIPTFINSQTKSAHGELSTCRDPRENPQQFAITLVLPVISYIAPKAQRKCYHGLSPTTSKMHDFEALHHRRYASDGAVRIIVQYDDTEASSDLFTLVSRPHMFRAKVQPRACTTRCQRCATRKTNGLFNTFQFWSQHTTNNAELQAYILSTK
jgi:hypothetical protein